MNIWQENLRCGTRKYKLLPSAFDDANCRRSLEVDTNGDHNTIYADGYYGEVNSFEQYRDSKDFDKKILMTVK